MSSINTILAEMNQTLSNPRQVIQDYKKETGKGVIGCFPVYCPEEIVHAAGMLPMGMWGGQTQLSLASTVLPAFCCSIMQSVMEFGLRGIYNDLDAVIISAPCDTLKSIGQDWVYTIPQIPAIMLVYPQMRKLEAGIEYLKTEYARVKKEVEAVAGAPISDEALQNSIEVYNQHRKTMRDFTTIARSYPITISPKVRHLVIKSAYFMEKSRHTALVQELIAELQKSPAEQWKGKKVVLTGITAEPDDLLDILQENNLAVVGDDLAHESRQFRTDVPAGNDPLRRLAEQWSIFEGCSMAYDPEKKRGDLIIDMVKETEADGVILCMMKFCDPEEFDYPILSVQFEEAKIPMLFIEIDQQVKSFEQSRTRIQGFAEMLSLRK